MLPRGRLPVATFAVIMGTCGLGLALRQASLQVPVLLGVANALFVAAAAGFVVLAWQYARESLRDRAGLIAEWSDPATSSTLAAPAIAISLLAAAAVPSVPALAQGLWLIAFVANVAVLLSVLGRWIVDPPALAKHTPAWFLPITGNATTIFAGAPLGHRDACLFSFAVAVMCWLTIQPLVFYRLFFAEPLPRAAVPSLAVLVSTPAVLASAWYTLVGPDLIFRILAFKALFLALLVVRLARLTAGLTYGVGWWAYTFSAAALAGAFVRYAQSSPRGDVVMPVLAVVLIAGAIAVYGGVALAALRSVYAARRTATMLA